MPRFTPSVQLSYLSDAAKSHIFSAALTVLNEVGALVHDPDALAILARAGCRVEGALVKVPRAAVEQALSTAPSVITLFDRFGEPAMELGGNNVYFGTGSDLMWQYDVKTGEHRPSLLTDIAAVARVCEALPNIDFVMSGGYPTELPLQGVYVATLLTMMENCTKPLVVVAENRVDLGVMIDIAAVLRGSEIGLRERPYLLVYVEPVSPLVHPSSSIAKLLLCADFGVPIAYVPAPLSGATAPISSAGHVVQGLAECLLGLVVHQMRTPGAPFMLGVNQGTLDMVTGQPSYTAVESYATFLCAVEMAKWLGLPNWGIAGCTDSQTVDTQLGMDLAELTLLAMLGGSNLNHDVGFMGFGLTGCLEEIVIADEFIALNKKLLGGLATEDLDLAVEAIAAVGPGGHYLGHPHTRGYLRNGMGQWRPSLLNRDNRDRWLERGGLDLRERARQKTLSILESQLPIPLEPNVKAFAEQRLAAIREGDSNRIGICADPEMRRSEEWAGEVPGDAGY